MYPVLSAAFPPAAEIPVVISINCFVIPVIYAIRQLSQVSLPIQVEILSSTFARNVQKPWALLSQLKVEAASLGCKTNVSITSLHSIVEI